MLATLSAICKDLHLEATEQKVAGPSGAQVSALGIKQGAYNLLAIETGKDAAVLVLPIQFSDQDAAVLARQSDEVLGRLQAVLSREMMEGRTGFIIIPHPKHPRAIGQIQIQQQIMVGSGLTERQRFLDAIQELATVATRCNSVLGHAFSAIQASAMQHPEYTFV